MNNEELALRGGVPVRRSPMPGRRLIGKREKEAVNFLFDKAISEGDVFGYGGPAEAAYCEEFVKYMGGDGYADGVNSGSSAVYIALRALDIEPFTEVIVSPITDPGGMMPVALLNCIPVVADSQPGSFNAGPEQISKLITRRTSAMVISHIAGEPADIKSIMTVARKRGIPVVEDCAQAFGAKLNGRLVGTFGKISAFSTMSGKHYCTGGQGGCVFTRYKKVYQKARWAADRGKPYGLSSKATNQIAALNLNMDELSAAIGKVQIKKLPSIVNRRIKAAQMLQNELFEQKVKAVSFPDYVEKAEPSYWFLRLRFNEGEVSCDKNVFCKALSAEGVPVKSNYRAMPHTYDWFAKKRVFGKTGLPWNSSFYRGGYNKLFSCPNAETAIRTHFRLDFNENWRKGEVRDTIRAMKKVEAAYACR